MLARAIPFLVAFALLLAGVFASSHAVPVTGATVQPSQELVMGDGQADEGTLQAEAETLSDSPDVLVGSLVVPVTLPAMPYLRPHGLPDRAPPDLKGPLRPPSASGLSA